MLSWRERQILLQEDHMFLVVLEDQEASTTQKLVGAVKLLEIIALVEKIKMVKLKAEGKYMEEKRSLVFQTS